MKRMIVSIGYGLVYLAMIAFYSYFKYKEIEEPGNAEPSGKHIDRPKQVDSPKNGFKKKDSLKSRNKLVKDSQGTMTWPLENDHKLL